MLDTEAAIRRNLAIGLFGILLLGGSATAWSFLAWLDSAVVTQGTVVVESNVKKVQHPTGGVIGSINVKEGQSVKEGDVVVRLDETATRAALGIVVNELTANRARVSRLVAERNATNQINFPADIVARAASEPDVKDVIEGEARLLASRLGTRLGLKAQLTERIGQLTEEVKGFTGQQKSLNIQLDVARQELEDLRGLEAKKLIPRPRITSLKREVARTEGLFDEMVGRTLSAKGKIVETQLQIIQLDTDHLSEITKELREAETRINELQERRISAEDQLRRVEIRAPITGTVHQLNVHTIGGVVSPSDPLMLIVPATDKLILEVRIQPQDIDQVHIGQFARVRFTAFNQRTTPELTGKVFRIGGDLTREQQTGLSYFLAGVSIDESEIAKLEGLQLLPGMPADAFITTGSRTFASYIVKPLTDQMTRSMRER